VGADAHIVVFGAPWEPSLRMPDGHGAKTDRACETSSGGELELVHIARIKAAALLDLAARSARSRDRKS
jgi:hypothetical protein